MIGYSTNTTSVRPARISKREGKKGFPQGRNQRMIFRKNQIMKTIEQLY